MPKPKKILCSIEGCERIKAYSFGICHACYQRMYYWDKRSIKDKMKRLKQIQVWENSLDQQLGNVHQIAKKRATR